MLTASSIGQEQLAEYVDLVARAKLLESEARTLRKRADTLKSHFRKVLEAIGKSRITRLGYVLAMVPGRVTVAWKDAISSWPARTRRPSYRPRPRHP